MLSARINKFLSPNWMERVTPDEFEQEYLIASWKASKSPELDAYKRLLYRQYWWDRADRAALKRQPIGSFNWERKLPLSSQQEILLGDKIDWFSQLSFYHRYVACLVADYGILEASKRLSEPLTNLSRTMEKIRKLLAPMMRIE